MKILLYDPDYISYSIDAFRQYLVPELSSRVQQLLWVSPQSRHHNFRKWLPPNHNVVFVDLELAKSHPYRWLNAIARRFLIILRIDSTKLAVSLSSCYNSSVIRLIARKNKVELIFCLAFMNQAVPRGNFLIAGILHDLSPSLSTSSLNNIDKWINASFCSFCVSRFTLDQLADRNYPSRLRNVHVVWPSPRFILDQLPTSKNLLTNFIPQRTSLVRIFMPASLDERKGHIFLLEAAISAIMNGIMISITVVGSGTDLLNEDILPSSLYETRLIDSCHKFRLLGGSLNALGHVSDSHFATLLDSSDVVVFPSLYEGFGLPVSEAVMVGLPVIASDLFPIREQLELFDCHDRVLLVPPGDSYALSLAILNCARGFGPFRVNSDSLASNFDRWTWSKAAASIIDQLNITISKPHV